MSVCEETDN